MAQLLLYLYFIQWLLLFFVNKIKTCFNVETNMYVWFISRCIQYLVTFDITQWRFIEMIDFDRIIELTSVIRIKNQMQKTFTNRNEIYLYVAHDQCLSKIETKSPVRPVTKEKTTKWIWECDCVDKMDSIRSDSINRSIVRFLVSGFQYYWLLTVAIVIEQHVDQSKEKTQIKRKQFNFWIENWVLSDRSVRIGYDFEYQVITDWIESLGISLNRWRWFWTTVESYKSIITIFVFDSKSERKTREKSSIWNRFFWISIELFVLTVYRMTLN